MGDMKIQNLLKALQDVQQEVDPRKAELEKVLKEELDALLEIEDLKCRQRVKENWLRYGDRNTKCVHACASHRSCRNHIRKVIDLDGKHCFTQRDIEGTFINYFQMLFTVGNDRDVDYCVRTVDQKVTPQMNQSLTAPISLEEIYAALNQMAPLKSPGLDGFPAYFFQQNWDILH
jgi:hypothetical protein